MLFRSEEMNNEMLQDQTDMIYQRHTGEDEAPAKPGKAPPATNTAQGPGGGGFSSTAPTEQNN